MGSAHQLSHAKRGNIGFLSLDLRCYRRAAIYVNDKFGRRRSDFAKLICHCAKTIAFVADSPLMI